MPLPSLPAGPGPVDTPGGPGTRLRATVTGPSGEQTIDVLANPTQTVGDVRQQLSERGFTLVNLQPITVQGLGGSTTTTSTFQPTRVPGLGTPADVGQLAGGGIGTMLGGPGLGAALGLGARGLLAERVPGQGRLAAGAQEVVRGIPGEVLAGASRLLPRAAEFVRGPRELPAMRTLAPKLGSARAAARVLGPEGEQAAVSLTGGTTSTLRSIFGPIHQNPVTGALAVRSPMRGLLRGVPKADRQLVMQQILDTTGIRLDAIRSRQLLQKIRSDPEQVVAAIQMLGKASGRDVQPVVARVARTLVSDAVRKSLVRPPVTPFPNVFRGGVLDPERLGKALGALRSKYGDDVMRQVYGRDGLQALDELSRELGAADLAKEYAQAGRPGPAKLTHVRLGPLVSALAVGAMGHHFGGIPGIAGELMGVKMASEEAGNLLTSLMTTGPGLRFVAAGIRLQRKGLTDTVLVPALARHVPAVIRSLHHEEPPEPLTAETAPQ